MVIGAQKAGRIMRELIDLELWFFS